MTLPLESEIEKMSSEPTPESEIVEIPKTISPLPLAETEIESDPKGKIKLNEEEIL